MSATRMKPRTGVCDCTTLDKPDEESIAEVLESRFKLGKPYTYIRDIIVSVNPYRKLDLYTSDFATEYRSTELFHKPPHIYAVADSAFHGMLLFRQDTCIIISGESGSGKTVASKYLTQYIVSLSPHTDSVRMKNQFILSHPLLESFGNARTLRNNNASRFGKYMTIAFNLNIVPKGGTIRTYLLDKERVVKQPEGERNFHCFYQLLAGGGDRLMQELKLDRNPSTYRYLGSGSTVTSADGSLFEDVLKAMMTLRFTIEDIDSVRKMLAVILHLGNVKISELKSSDETQSASVDLKQLSVVAGLLGTEVKQLAQFLTHRRVGTGNGGVEKNLSAQEARCRQDMLAMLLYERLFQVVLRRVNRALSVNLSGGVPTTVIGLLDFYGFETLETNGFEQFCINYCNERLHQMFTNLVLKREQQVYKEEGIRWEHIDFSDNEPTCRMIESMMVVLNEECCKPQEERSSENVLKQFDERFSENDNYVRVSADDAAAEAACHKQFQVIHQAGKVTYDVTDFVSRDKDTELSDIKRVLFNSKLAILKEMFPEGAETDAATERRPEEMTKVGTRLKSDITELINLIGQQTLHWVRCIVPNLEKNQRLWNSSLVLNQVRSLGLVEATKMRKSGYAHWMTYDRFVWRYKMLDDSLWPTTKLSAKEATKKLVSSHNIRDKVVFGKTQLFFRTHQTIFMLEAERQKKLPHLGMLVYRSIKSHYCKQMKRKTNALMTMLTCYRRKFVADWFREVVEKFKDCATMSPDYGRSLEWPKPPPAMILAKRLLQRVHLNWWARKKITQYTRAEQYQLRLKAAAYGFLHGKKPGLQLEEKWLGDELGNRSFNSKATQFTDMMSVYQDVNGDTKRLYSCHVTKLNRHLKADHRIFVLCDKHLYHLTSDYQLSKRSMIEVDLITGISISDGNDQAMVIHCVRRYGDCVFYLENNRPASEFMAAIWNLIRRKYNRQLPIKVTDTMKFARPNQGIDVGSIRLQRSRRGKAPSFKKRGEKNASLTWPRNENPPQLTLI